MRKNQKQILEELAERVRSAFDGSGMCRRCGERFLQPRERLVHLRDSVNCATDAFKWKYPKLGDRRDFDKFLEDSAPLLDELTAEARGGQSDVGHFILDEAKVHQEAAFPFMRLGDGVYAFGFLLPREREDYAKDGTLRGTRQERAPALITSQRELIPIGWDFTQKYKLFFRALPTEYPQRWSLGGINRFLKDETKTPTLTELFQSIRGTYARYYFAPDETWYDVHALWDIATYFFFLFEYFPLMELRGMPGAGKNKVMALSRKYTFNSTEEMTAPSEATLFRLTEEQRPTKYIDEAEKLFKVVKGKVETDNRAELINSSYKKTGRVPRQEPTSRGKYTTCWYNTYSPTMIASINGLFGATQDRAIIHISVKPPAGDGRSELEPPDNSSDFTEVRDGLYVFALLNAGRVEKEYNSLKLETDLKARDYWLWKPLLTIGSLIDKEEDAGLCLRIVEFAKKMNDIKRLDGIPEGSFEYRVLAATHTLLKLGGDSLLVKDIAEQYKRDSGFDKAPSSRSICGLLDRSGLYEFKGTCRNGTNYHISLGRFQELLFPIIPALFDAPKNSSQTSQTSQTREKEDREGVKIGEDGEVCESFDSSQTSQRKEENTRVV